MKKIISAGIGLLALTGAAAAADLPVKAPVYKAPPVVVDPWTWTGFYIGVNVGYSWGKSETDATFTNNTTGVLLAAGSSDFKLNGAIGGGQIGANWQNGIWVIGGEADIQWSGQKGSTTFSCPTPAIGGPCNTLTFGPGFGVSPTAAFDQKLEWFGTVRARLGVTPAPTVLLYVTGGWAFGEIQTDGVISGFSGAGVAVSSAFSHSTTKSGWTVGGGIEGRLSGNWTGKIEYLYMDLGSVSGTATLLTSTPPLRFDYSSRITDNIVRVGLNYKFQPYVVAKY
jgi:outer membrane immunogenic protein